MKKSDLKYDFNDRAKYSTRCVIQPYCPAYPEEKVEVSDNGCFIAIDQSEAAECNLGVSGFPSNAMQRFMNAQKAGDYLTAAKYDAMIKAHVPDFDIPADVSPESYAKRIMPSGYQSPAEIGRFAEYIGKLQQDETVQKQKAAYYRQEAERAVKRAKAWDDYFESLKTESEKK